MEPTEAAEIIRDMAASLRASPSQFNVVFGNVIGTSVVQRGPGTGLSVTVSAGGSGTVIGFQSTATVGGGDNRTAVETARIASALEAIAGELSATKPDKGKVASLFEALGRTWVPGIITSVLGNLLTMALGISPGR